MTKILHTSLAVTFAKKKCHIVTNRILKEILVTYCLFMKYIKILSKKFTLHSFHFRSVKFIKISCSASESFGFAKTILVPFSF